MPSKEQTKETVVSEMMTPITLFMCGDVMTGRGIDQILPHPGNRQLHELWMKDATGYVKLAEAKSGPIPHPVNFTYIWGDAMAVLDRSAPDVRLINLETSITKSNDYWEGKAIHYRMHPKNIPCITTAKISCCSLANNHVLDWGYAGLSETLKVLKQASVRYAGAGHNLREAGAPAVLEVIGKGRVLVFSLGVRSSGIPSNWRASENRPGVNLLADLSVHTVESIKEKIQTVKQPNEYCRCIYSLGRQLGV